MSSVRELQHRIQSTRNIAKMTKALQMVASSKIYRAQMRMKQSRVYAERLNTLVKCLEIGQYKDTYRDIALLQQRPIQNIGVIVMSPDRTLCGALPGMLNRMTLDVTRAEQKRNTQHGHIPELHFIAVGKRGRDMLVRTNQHIVAEFTNYGSQPSIDDAIGIAKVALDAFLHGNLDLILLVYPQFVSLVNQTPVAMQLLPIQAPAPNEQVHQNKEYIYEPDANQIVEALLPRYINIKIYQALLETVASELAAQMLAMKSATDNANDLLKDLTLAMNKARQTTITTQILEVVAGANSLDE